MTFSIIIPLYNKAPYICKALDSVWNQTFLDYECIIVDDGSTDGSVAIVEQWIAAHTPLTLSPSCLSPNSLIASSPIIRLITQENYGVAAARNHGVAASNGEYLCFLDADDWWKPTFLEEMSAAIAQYPEAGLWACNYIYYKPGKTHIGVKSTALVPSPPSLVASSPMAINYPLSYYKNVGMIVSSSSVCISRMVFDEMGGFPKGIKLGEDFLLWAKVAMQYEIVFVDKALAYYNNDVPARLRATRNLYPPEENMLGHLPEKEAATTSEADDWKSLFDMFRVDGLMDYWLDTRYHDFAKEELEKVDWSQQASSIARQYHWPRWWLRLIRRVVIVGFCVKSRISRHIIK